MANGQRQRPRQSANGQPQSAKGGGGGVERRAQSPSAERRDAVCAGKLLTGNIGSLCEQQQPLKALRAPGGPIPQYKILFYYWCVGAAHYDTACSTATDRGAAADRGSRSLHVSATFLFHLHLSSLSFSCHPRTYHLSPIRPSSAGSCYLPGNFDNADHASIHRRSPQRTKCASPVHL
jgi:hypothetical protein